MMFVKPEAPRPISAGIHPELDLSSCTASTLKLEKVDPPISGSLMSAPSMAKVASTPRCPLMANCAVKLEAPLGFVKLLGRRGYRLAEFQHIWFRSLDEDERPRVHSDELEVREIGPDEADVWIRTVTRGFAGHDEVTGKEMSIAAMTFRIPANRCFLARLEGEPVGGGVLSVNDGCAALFSGSTLAAARRRGVQTALIGARLDAAIAAGCELASVKTSPGNDSQRNVERAGFRLAYTRAALILERTDAA